MSFFIPKYFYLKRWYSSFPNICISGMNHSMKSMKEWNNLYIQCSCNLRNSGNFIKLKIFQNFRWIFIVSQQISSLPFFLPLNDPRSKLCYNKWFYLSLTISTLFFFFYCLESKMWVLCVTAKLKESNKIFTNKKKIEFLMYHYCTVTIIPSVLFFA